MTAPAHHESECACTAFAELRQLRTAIKASGEIIFMTDAKGIFTAVNPEFTRVYGYTPPEVVGLVTPRILKSGTTDADAYEAFWKQLQQKEVVRREFMNRTKDGRLLQIAVSANPILSESGSIVGFLAVQRDVTEERQLERSVLETARQFETLAKTASDAIFIVNGATTIEYCNDAAARMFGHQASVLVGRGLHDVFPKKIADEMWRQLSAVFSTSTRQLFEYRFEVPDGDLWLETWLAPMSSDGDSCQSVMGIARDITQRKLLERQFLQAQKMEAVGRLAGGVAHDFNNLLTAILGYADLVSDRLADAPDVAADVQEIRKAGEQAGRLTRHLLAFTRNQPAKPQLMDVSAVIADATNMMRRVVGEDVVLSVTSAPPIGLVMADPGQIEQVVLNLVVNARDAMPKGGPLIIATTNAEVDEAFARRYPDGKAGRFVKLAVRDAGCGMTADVLAHACEPFFTTKPASKGTGLGLATVYGIVKQNGGWIAIDSAPGTGTVVSTFWPRDEEAHADASERTPPAAAALNGSETILVVEDEPGIRSLMCRTLRLRGYHVLEASDPTAAIGIAETHAEPIDLLLTDIIMPLLNGPDMAQRIVKHQPAIRVLYVSGYPHTFAAGRVPAPGRLWFLAKPFTPQALALAIRECLSYPRVSCSES